MINGSSRRDLLLNSQNFCRSIPAGAENPSLSRLCYRRLWGSRNRRALILGWAYYLDAFSSYPLRTWLPSVYRGHDNWHTRGLDIPRILLKERSALGNADTGGAWLSSARAVRGREPIAVSAVLPEALGKSE
ncbi:hypothetical protein L6164_035298 [Bauhinia variegata]|uniref:Uncharacterized protein n=1 Tax=Bauhinia variegata TaxID=167791 RepID=A0ACB9KZI3_BAUVA|nr:hypothetical protein L6164_035298 [Bauhinia variegata]